MSDRTSLSASGPPTTKPTPLSSYQNTGISHPPSPSPLNSAPKGPPLVKPVSIKVPDGPDGAVPGFLHLPADFPPTPAETSADAPLHKRTAAILLSGAGGGLVGPSSMYLSLAAKLPALAGGIPVLRLDYRYPARNKYCCADVRAAMDHLCSTYALNRFVLVGWSFGGAPVFTVGGEDGRVVGCATVASQTAETEGIRRLAPRPVLLLHGTADRTLSPSCSERLYAMYGAKGDRQIAFFDRDDHALTRNANKAEEMLAEFIMRCAGVGIEERERKGIVETELVKGGERVEKMRRGGDLRGEESVE